MLKPLITIINKEILMLRNILISRTEKLIENSEIEYFVWCSCLDELEDTMLAIEDYLQNGIGIRDGEKYLKIYGLLQAIIIQQDVIKELFSLNNSCCNFQDGFKEIRHLRVCIAGHPVNSQRGELVHFISRASITDKVFDIMSYNKQNKRDTSTEINYYSLVENYLDELKNKLSELLILVSI